MLALVLILVLMEDTLRGQCSTRTRRATSVLILVLMEDTLRVNSEHTRLSLCLCLNPCFNGRYSQRSIHKHLIIIKKVLILVLMEDTLRDCYACSTLGKSNVLILVLMEDTLRARSIAGFQRK